MYSIKTGTRRIIKVWPKQCGKVENLVIHKCRKYLELSSQWTVIKEMEENLHIMDETSVKIA